MVTYRYIDDQNLVLGVLTGDLDDEQLLATADDVSANERIRPGYFELVDTRHAASMDRLSAEGLRKVAARASPHLRPPGGRMALVVAESLTYGLARMYSVYAEETRSEIEVFRDIEEACAWLGIDCARDEIREFIDG
jgi:hypothetical protein